MYSGRLVQDAIDRHIDRSDCPLSEVVIDFTRVDYEVGDGPVWSVLPAVSRGLKVTYLVSKRNREPLQLLMSLTNMDKSIGVVAVEDP